MTATSIVDDPKIEIDRIVNPAKIVINLFKFHFIPPPLPLMYNIILSI